MYPADVDSMILHRTALLSTIETASTICIIYGYNICDSRSVSLAVRQSGSCEDGLAKQSDKQPPDC